MCNYHVLHTMYTGGPKIQAWWSQNHLALALVARLLTIGSLCLGGHHMLQSSFVFVGLILHKMI